MKSVPAFKESFSVEKEPPKGSQNSAELQILDFSLEQRRDPINPWGARGGSQILFGDAQQQDEE